MRKNNKLIIVGCGKIGDMMYEYFTYDSPYEVVAFCAEEQFIKKSTKHNLPIISLEKLETIYPVNEYKVFVALSSNKQNRIRTILYRKIKQKGYSCANYICSSAKLWPSVQIGENCCIMDFCVAEPNAIIGSNVTLFHGTFIGHNSNIGDNCWIVCSVISGLVTMGKSCFVGANSAIADSIVIEDDCFIAIGSAVNKNCSKGGIYVGNPARKRKANVYRMFKIPEKS